MKGLEIQIPITSATGAGKIILLAIRRLRCLLGTYKIDEVTNQVAHTLVGSINPANIGITVYRNLQVEGDELTIQLDTTTQEG